MGSVSDPDSRRRIAVGTAVQAELINSLMGCFRESPRYQNVIAQDLRPRWKRAEPVIVAAGGPRLLDFDRACRLLAEQVWEEEDTGAPRDPDLADYVETLRRFVCEKMRLARSGEPASWATTLVHYDVRGYPVAWPSDAFYGEERATIALRVTPAGGRAEARDADGGIVGHRQIDTFGFDFDRGHRSLIEAEAHALLSETFAKLWEQYERRYPAPVAPRRYPDPLYARHNRATLEKWHREFVPALFKLLFLNEDAGRPSRDTLGRVAGRIGIDLPA